MKKNPRKLFWILFLSIGAAVESANWECNKNLPSNYCVISNLTDSSEFNENFNYDSWKADVVIIHRSNITEIPQNFLEQFMNIKKLQARNVGLKHIFEAGGPSYISEVHIRANLEELPEDNIPADLYDVGRGKDLKKRERKVSKDASSVLISNQTTSNPPIFDKVETEPAGNESDPKEPPIVESDVETNPISNTTSTKASIAQTSTEKNQISTTNSSEASTQSTPETSETIGNSSIEASTQTTSVANETTITSTSRSATEPTTPPFIPPTSGPLQLPAKETLEEIYLDGNQIEVLRSGELGHAPNLKIISLIGNSIKEIEIGAFSGSNNLLELHLEKNSIRILDENIFKELRSLKFLNLDENFIVKFNFHVLPNVKNLSVSLRNNRIRFLEGRNFVDKVKVTINLEDNICYNQSINGSDSRPNFQEVENCNKDVYDYNNASKCKFDVELCEARKEYVLTTLIHPDDRSAELENCGEKLNDFKSKIQAIEKGIIEKKKNSEKMIEKDKEKLESKEKIYKNQVIPYTVLNVVSFILLLLFLIVLRERHLK